MPERKEMVAPSVAAVDGLSPLADGEMGELIRAHDWRFTPLGAPSAWPESLRTALRIMLTSRHPMWAGWGPHLTFLYNDAYRPVLDSKHPWALGQPANLVWAEVWPQIGPRIEGAIATGVATWDEALLLFLKRSGYTEETYHTFSCSPLLDDDGSIGGVLCVTREVTERIIGDRRQASLQDLADAVATTAAEPDVLAAIERALGRNSKDLPFTLVYVFESEGTRARLACCTGISPDGVASPGMIDLGDSGAAWPAASMVSAAGSIVVEDLARRFGALPAGAWGQPPSRAVLVPIRPTDADSALGFLVAGVNPYRQFDSTYDQFLHLAARQVACGISNARSLAEERARAESLAALDRAKTEFFANITHEFRTPLSLMMGPAEDILSDASTKPFNEQRAELIHRNALRLSRLVNTVLDFTRIEAGRMQVTFEPTDLAAYTADLASNFRSAVERGGLALIVNCPPLPPTLPPAYVDRAMWEKVVFNLLSNALKHTFEGDISVRVFVRDGSAVLQVQDTGVGIAPDQLPFIFDRFHRVRNVRARTYEGSGIGLPFAHELVNLHGGTISVESAVDVGTTFTVSLPLGADHLPADRIGTAEAGGNPQLSSLGGGAAAYVQDALRWLPAAESAIPRAMVEDPSSEAARIVVVDDNTDMREYIARLFRARGWDVETAHDGMAALEAARNFRPDLIVSDVRMPRLGGVELMKALDDDPRTRGTPVILVSALIGEEARVEGMAAGAVDYLVKPFAARELLARVAGHLQRARAAVVVQSERARLQELFARAPAAIAVLRGPSHIIETANAHCIRAVGGRAVVGKPVREALPELAGQGIFELLDKVYSTGRTFAADWLSVMLDARGNGIPEERCFNLVYQPLRQGGGSISGIFVHAVDVTEQVRARKDAENANRVKSEFLAAMSHELRTPLNSIAGHAQLIEMGIHGPVTPEQTEALGRLQKSGQHLLSLVNDVLNFAKLEAGRVEYHVDNVMLADAVRSVTSMIEPQLAGRRLEYENNVAVGLGVCADREKVEQILLNLLSNAIKFTAPEGKITLNAHPDGDVPNTISLEVTDTGVGIPHEKHEEIFDPFVQVNRNLTRSTEGTGLGLSISRDLARGMGGDLRVRSAPGTGSTFTLVLPRAVAGTGGSRDTAG